MPVAIGEAVHLVLDRGAVARADAADLAREKRRAIEIGANDVVRVRVGPGDRAEELGIAARARSSATSSNRRRRTAAAPARSSRSCGRRAAAACRSSAGPAAGQDREADAPSPVAARSPIRPPASLCMPKCSLAPRKVPVASTTRAPRAPRRSPASRRQPAAPRAAASPPRPRRPTDPAGAETARWIAALEQLAIGLDARSAHRRALARVEHPVVDRRRIRRHADQAVKSIDLADQMALAEPADRRIAGHRADLRADRR